MYFARNVLAIAVAGVMLLGATPAPSPSPSPPPALAGETPDAVTHHTDTIGGTPYAYSARAGTITLLNAMEQPSARVFYTAYTLDTADPTTRPVTFIYNGGPGSSTMWLRMGSIGPVHVMAGNGRPS